MRSAPGRFCACCRLIAVVALTLIVLLFALGAAADAFSSGTL